MNQQKEIIVVGHKSPDTDSICSAIAYANLKNKLTGQQYTPRRAGDLNKETAFALSYFGVEPPAYLADVRTRVSDMEIKEVPAVNAKISIKQAYSLMKECEASTLCITNEENHLEGLITISNVAASDMDVYDNRIVSKAKTPYENIVKVLEAKVICGDVSGTFDQGRVTIAANTPERMVDYVAEHDMVIIGNRFESQFFAIEIGASCIILCTNAEPNETIIERAKSKGCIILSSPYDSYTVARLINQSMPIDFFMTAHHILSFSLEDYTDDVKEVMARERHRYFPVLDDDGHYIGVVSRRNMMNLHKKQLILVDHNEKGQAVEGIDQAEILEIIDHHRIGSMETDGPVYFRNVPVGCTCTIIYQMYRENGVELDRSTAGLLLSAILSDTLMFRSPTCTPLDEQAGRELAKLTGVDLEQYANAMFEAGGDVTGRTAEEVFNTDYKIFNSGEVRFGVGQGSYLTEKNRKASEALIGPYLQTALEKQGLDYIFYMFTDVRNSSTELLMAGKGAESLVEKAFDTTVTDGMAVLPGVISRKKQMVPVLINAIKQERG